MKTYSCPNCHTQRDVEDQILGKIGGALIGSLAGGTTNDTLTTVSCMIIGTLIGHVIDESVLPRYPECGTILEFIAEALN
jgi:outer membrane lipoprotein SlyB